MKGYPYSLRMYERKDGELAAVGRSPARMLEIIEV
jgi:hypothetical protein